MLNITNQIYSLPIFENNQELDKNTFKFLAQIGAGSFGKVYRVSSWNTGKLYAMKVLSKN